MAGANLEVNTLTDPDSGKIAVVDDLVALSGDVTQIETDLNDGKYNTVVNRLKGNQNLNVAGPDGLDLPGGTPTNYPTPDTQFAAGWYVETAIVGLTYVGGVLDATSGSYYRLYGGDRTSDFNAVKKGDNATSTTGVLASFDGTNTKITVDFATAGPHKFPQMSEQKGVAPNISDEESMLEATGLIFENRSPFTTANSYEIDKSGKITFHFYTQITKGAGVTWAVINIPLPIAPPNGILSAGATISSPSSNQLIITGAISDMTNATVYLNSTDPVTQDVYCKIEAY